MARLPPEGRRLLVSRLAAARMAGEVTAQVRAAAEGIGVAQRTIWRWLAAEESRSAGRRPYRLGEADRDAHAAAHGNAAAAWRARQAAGAAMPSLRAFQAAIGRDLLPIERAAVAEGSEGRPRHTVYLRWEASARNERWEADHVELPVLVLPPRASRPCKPWITLFLDAYSRLVMGWALSLAPNAATVLAALQRGLVVDPERGPFGGVPQALRPDRGLEFATEALTTATAALGIRLLPAPAYSPHLKGKVERLGRSIAQDFPCTLPFYTDGPRKAAGRLYGPADGPLTLARFAAEFRDWVAHYNLERPHGALGGHTPLDRWQADATPLRSIPDAELRFLLLAGQTRTIGKDGIRFGGLTFMAPELNGRVGQTVEVRAMPHDLRQIEVFLGGRWLATAHPQGLLSPEERQRVLERRRADAAELARRQRRATRQARTRLAPITGPEVIEDTTVVTVDQATLEAGRRWNEDLRRLARTDLLGLDRSH